EAAPATRFGEKLLPDSTQSRFVDMRPYRSRCVPPHVYVAKILRNSDSGAKLRCSSNCCARGRSRKNCQVDARHEWTIGCCRKKLEWGCPLAGATSSFGSGNARL